MWNIIHMLCHTGWKRTHARTHTHTHTRTHPHASIDQTTILTASCQTLGPTHTPCLSCCILACVDRPGPLYPPPYTRLFTRPLRPTRNKYCVVFKNTLIHAHNPKHHLYWKHSNGTKCKWLRETNTHQQKQKTLSISSLGLLSEVQFVLPTVLL